MISNFGGRELGSNNNSTSSNNSNAGSESPLPSPRFSRYIRPHQQGSHSRDSSSDNNSGVSHNDSSSRPTSATSSSTYSPRLGKHCSQAPSGVNLGKLQINYYALAQVVKWHDRLMQSQRNPNSPKEIPLIELLLHYLLDQRKRHLGYFPGYRDDAHLNQLLSRLVELKSEQGRMAPASQCFKIDQNVLFEFLILAFSIIFWSIEMD